MKTLCLRTIVLGIATFVLATSARASAQQPVETAVYTVAYVEVIASARSAAVAALKTYRDASRGEDGHVRIDLFEQAGWPGHFVVIEAWRDQKALDTHAAAPALKQFRDGLEPIRVSGYDQRPYKPLAAAASAATPGGQAVHIVAHVDVGPGGAQADPPGLLRRLAEASRKEAGNVRFDVLQHSMRANHFTVVETWQNQRALDAHAAATHTKQYRDTLQPISGSPLDENLYRAVE